MIMRLLSFGSGIYTEIGPGLILAVILPLSVVVLALVLREVAQRLGSERGDRTS